MELETLLSKLKMDHLEAQMDALCEQAAQRELDYQTFLTEALRAEWQGRFQRGIETRLRQSRFPWVKTRTLKKLDTPRETRGKQAGLSLV
jgi:DNA replication protein DnaC